MVKTTSKTQNKNILQWGRLLMITGGTQAVVQGFGLLIGTFLLCNFK